MTDETNQDPNAKGLPEGVTPEDADNGKRGDGAPEAPEVNNQVPKVEDKDSKGDDVDKDSEKAKEEADKKAKEEADKEESKTKEIEIPEDYEDYGDDNANAIVGILKEAEIPVKEAYDLFLESMQTGDFSKVNREVLNEKLGKAKADLVILGAQTYYTSQTKAVKEIVDAVHDVAGSKDNFDTVLKWAREKSANDAEFKKQAEEYNRMFDLNKTAARSAAKDLIAAYEGDKGNSSLNRKQVHGDKASTTPDAVGDFISRADYNKELNEAYAKNDMRKVNELNARRQSSLSNK